MIKRFTLVTMLCLVICTAVQTRFDTPVAAATSDVRADVEIGAEESVSGTLTLAFVGDLMAHTENLRSTPYREAFRYVGDELSRADLTFANLEFVVDPARPASGYPRFNGSVSYVEEAIVAGIDVFSVANNHSFDLGVTGVTQTIRTLGELSRSNRIHYSGMRSTAPAPAGGTGFEVSRIETGGVSIGFLAVTSFLNRLVRSDTVQIADYARPEDRKALLDTIRAVRDGFDLFILSYHGGIEYSREPDPGKVSLFSECIDAGVDIVWSHHPHVLQPWSVVNGESRSGFVMYSLGNFLSGQPWYFNPAAPNDEIAYRGESVIITIEIEPVPIDTDEAREVSSPEYRIGRISAVPIIHFPDIDGFIRVVPMDQVDSIAVTEAWANFLAVRKRHLTDFLNTHTAIAAAR